MAGRGHGGLAGAIAWLLTHALRWGRRRRAGLLFALLLGSSRGWSSRIRRRRGSGWGGGFGASAAVVDLAAATAGVDSAGAAVVSAAAAPRGAGNEDAPPDAPCGGPALAHANVFPASTLDAIEEAIVRAERAHAGRDTIRHRNRASAASHHRRDRSSRPCARGVLGLRVWDTEHNNGVLIYVLVADQSVEIVADRGVAARVAAPNGKPYAA